MSEQDFYKVLFDEKIFDPFAYDIGSIPKEITFGEFIFKYEKPIDNNKKGYVVVSYYKSDANIPEIILNSINAKYITSECGLHSEPQGILKKLIVDSCDKLYITHKLGLRIFIDEMKSYFTRVYVPNNARIKTK